MKETLCFTEIPSNQDYLFKYICHKNFVQGSTILATSAFFKEQIKEVNQFSDFLFHDHLFALKASINNGIIYLPDCTIRYRQHGEQVTKNLNTINKNKKDKYYQKNNRYFIICKIVQSLFESNNLCKLHNKIL